ncbi:hypothetical protein FOZ62_026295 [Perkinsus olseni]|uniref:Uncharacterized protein n=1 Tax=Perkinsus olseni TaxID=32597 RepID=A0A7J6PJV6_PEROL|nr:hypothetical protein FOZ62_026295 [Perkinsus olseni]
MRKLSSEVLEGHVEKLNRSKELYCMLGASSRGYTWPKFSEDGLMVRLDPSQLRILADFGLTSQFLAEFEAHLSRESPKDAFVLKAMDAEIFEYDPGAGWVVNPEFNGNRLCELLSRSQTAAPLRGEKAEDTCKRQLKQLLPSTTDAEKNSAKPIKNFSAKWSRAFIINSVAVLVVQEAESSSAKIPDQQREFEASNSSSESDDAGFIFFLDMLACHERLLWYAAEYNWSVAACVDKSVRQAIDATCRGGTRSLAQYYKSFDLWSGKASEAALP